MTVMRPDLAADDDLGMDGLRKLALGELACPAYEASAVALITHDIDFAAEAAQAVTTMAHGRALADRAPRLSWPAACSSRDRSRWQPATSRWRRPSPLRTETEATRV